MTYFHAGFFHVLDAPMGDVVFDLSIDSVDHPAC
jgi:hypothetical protein